MNARLVGKIGERERIPWRGRLHVLSVSLEPREPAVIAVTVQVEGIVVPPAEFGLPYVEALVSWGSTYGRRHEARVTVGRGTTFHVNATDLSVELANLDAPETEDTRPTALVTASASLGGSTRLVAPIYEGPRITLSAGSTSSLLQVPPFASHLTLLSTLTLPAAPGGLPGRVEWIEGNSANSVIAAQVLNPGDRMLVPPHADRYRVTNDDDFGRGNAYRPIFDLAF